MSAMVGFLRHIIWIALLGAGSVAAAQSKPMSAAEIAATDAQCTSGNVDACETVVKAYRYGLGVAKDPARAAQLELRNCKAGDGKSCESYAFMMKRKSAGFPAYDAATYNDLMKQACFAKTRPNCGFAGGMAKHQNVYTPAEREAILKQVCAVDTARRCGDAAYAEGKRGNWASALSLARTACSRGNSNACTNVKAYQARADNARRAQQRSARQSAPTYTDRPIQRTTPAPAPSGRTYNGNSNARSGTRSCTKSNGGSGKQYWYYGFDNRKKYGPCV